MSAEAAVDELGHPAFCSTVGFPELARWNLVHERPGRCSLDLLSPRPSAAVAVEEVRHLGREPAPGVDAVGDVGYRLLLAREEVAPHVERDFTVQFGDGVARRREVHSQDGHIEGWAPILLVVAEAPQYLVVGAQSAGPPGGELAEEGLG